jgi:hypothetical protein
MKKVWSVKIGNNWETLNIIAKNYQQAAKTALRITVVTGKEKYVSAVVFVLEVAN